ncbi:MAG: helix-turn-helix domain-containing protein [Clostridiales bacterium]|nr:helix-turn-helix domain-containing protein [Clostridiales bacterium]
MEKQAYNVAEVAKIMGVCKGTVRKLIEAGKLNAVRPTPKRILISMDSIKAYLNNDRA